MQYPVASPHIGPKEREYVLDCLDAQWISSSGTYITTFEEQFARMFGPGRCVATGNGTVALDLAMNSLGIKDGDEVIVPNFTFAGTVSPIYRAHGIPVFIPPGSRSWNMDPACLEALITTRTKAVAVVHLYGVPCNMSAIMELAQKYNLLVIEDCAEALGAKINGQFVGTFGDVACYSFFGNKVLTTGEGGMCMTQSEKVYEKLRLYRDHGMKTHERYWHRVIGYNGRMTNLQAAIGCGQLEHVQSMIARRNEIHKIYQATFSTREYFLKLDVPQSAEAVNWLESPVLLDKRSLDRDLLITQLKAEGIDSRPFFYPMSNMPAFSRYGIVDPLSNYYASHGLNLPTYTSMTDDDVAHVAQKTVEILDRQDRKGSGVTIPFKTPAPEDGPVLLDVSVIFTHQPVNEDAVERIGLVRRQLVAAGLEYEILLFTTAAANPMHAAIQEKFGMDSRVRLTCTARHEAAAGSSLGGYWSQARGRHILVLNASASGLMQVSEVMKMAVHYDLVKVSRFLPGASDMGISPLLRLQNHCRGLLLGLPAMDLSNECFCMSMDALKALDAQSIFNDNSDYLPKLLRNAVRQRLRILELPAKG